MAPRVMIIGLDGATFHFIRPLVAAGRLPVLAGLMARGASGELHSTFPPHTAAAWTTCVTGQRPGNHGVLYFHQLDPSKYSGRGGISTSDAMRGRTIFDVASAHDMRVAAIHVPLTFPAWQVNGVMVTGYPTPAGSPACAYPQAFAARVGKLHEITRTSSPEKRLAFSLSRIALLTELGEQALAEQSPDLFMTVFQDSDAAHHYFWRYHDRRSPAYTEADAQRYGDYIPQVYESLDRAVGKLVSHAGPDTTIFIVSDHGGDMAAPNAFHVNAWLAGKGLLGARDVAPSLMQRAYAARRWLLPASVRGRLSRMVQRANLEGFDELRSGLTQVDWSRTLAYRFMVTAQVEGIALNVIGRQPQGTVQPGAQYEEVRSAIIADLRALRTPDSHEPLVAEVYRREEIFAGRNMEHAPDIVFRLHPLYRVGAALRPPLFTRLTAVHLSGPRNGWHDDFGILIAAGSDVSEGVTVPDASILNMAPTFLRALGLRQPQWMDGSVQAGIFTPSQVERELAAPATASVAQEQGIREASDGEGDPVAAPGAAQYALSSREEQSIKERLQNLGYL
jgi:predicted AlkP superfamily phosphohydrolase/phosphomutase